MSRNRGLAPIFFAFFLIALLLTPASARADELTLFNGTTRSDEPRARSFGWSLAYSHDLGEHLSASLTYQNEGHLPGHHRDGYAMQVWGRRALARQFSLAAGIGPYRYFDTVPAANAAGYSDHSGWGLMFSVAASWRPPDSPWFLQLRFNHAATRGALRTNALQAGIGHQLERDSASQFASRARKSEVTLLGGQSIVNSLQSENSRAKSIELRHAFGPILRGSVGWLDEGDAKVVQRKGLVAQAWLEPTFYEDRFSLGAGIGPYVASDKQRPEKTHFVTSIASLTTSIRFGSAWTLRLTANRVFTRYDRDADVLLIGAGYRF